ncbi:MAG: hypothetical protein AAB821_00915 [Patescibacteria group bacterium]
MKRVICLGLLVVFLCLVFTGCQTASEPSAEDYQKLFRDIKENPEQYFFEHGLAAHPSGLFFYSKNGLI